MAEQSPPDPYLEHLDFLVSSFTDNGKSLRGFVSNPQELSISILTAGLLANSKLMISPDDAIKSAFDIHARIQNHVGQFQNMQFVWNHVLIDCQAFQGIQTLLLEKVVTFRLLFFTQIIKNITRNKISCLKILLNYSDYIYVY